MDKAKLFTGTIFLSGNVAIKSITDKTVIEELPENIAKNYDDFCVDSIYIIDLSKNYIEHECSLGTIERIVKDVDIPVIVAGCIRNKGDIDRLFEIGVSKVVLNFSKDNNVCLADEIRGLYDPENLLAAITSVENLFDNRLLIEEVTSGIVVMKDQIIHDCLKITDMDFMIPCGDVSLDKIIDILKYNNISGIFGRFVELNLNDINSIKGILKESGVNTTAFECKIPFEELTVNEAGLIPVIVQDYKNGDVLMMAWMNKLAYENTCKTGRMNYYSRSRKSQWIKGETSGHYQYVKSLHADCDSDTLLARISQVGAACHTGSRSCFFKEIVKREIL